MSPLIKSLLKQTVGAGAGVGLSAAENTLIDDPGLEKVNLGLGGVTGALVGGGGLSRNKALLGLAGKQMGLLGINAYQKDAPARTQAANANRDAAMANKETEGLKLQGAREDQVAKGQWSTQDKLLAAGLGLGAGAFGVYGLNSLKGKKKSKPVSQEVLKGDPAAHRRQKLRIDVPADSLPPEFFQSLIDADGRTNALTTLRTKTASFDVEMDRADVLAGLAADLDKLFEKRAGDPIENFVWPMAKEMGGQLGRGLGFSPDPATAAALEQVKKNKAGAPTVPAAPVAAQAGAPQPTPAVPTGATSGISPVAYGAFNNQPQISTGSANIRNSPYAGPMARTTPGASQVAPLAQAAGINPSTPMAANAPAPATAPVDPRQANIAAAKADGSFAANMQRFNDANVGRQVMDANGAISQVPQDPRGGTITLGQGPNARTITGANNMSAAQVGAAVRNQGQPSAATLRPGETASQGANGMLTYDGAPGKAPGSLGINNRGENVMAGGGYKPVTATNNPASAVGAQMPKIGPASTGGTAVSAAKPTTAPSPTSTNSPSGVKFS